MQSSVNSTTMPVEESLPWIESTGTANQEKLVAEPKLPELSAVKGNFTQQNLHHIFGTFLGHYFKQVKFLGHLEF